MTRLRDLILDHFDLKTENKSRLNFERYAQFKGVDGYQSYGTANSMQSLVRCAGEHSVERYNIIEAGSLTVREIVMFSRYDGPPYGYCSGIPGVNWYRQISPYLKETCYSLQMPEWTSEGSVSIGLLSFIQASVQKLC